MTADNSLLGNLVDAREEERRARWRAHVVELVQTQDDGWHPRCSCGWSATASSPTRRLAFVEADEHIDAEAYAASQALPERLHIEPSPAPLVDRDTGDEG